MGKFITKSVYWAYELLQNNAIQKQLVELKLWENLSVFEKTKRIESFLSQKGFNPVLTENPIQTKEDIKRLSSNIDQNLVKSWAYTGGSYGEPLRVPYSKQRNTVRTATFKFFNELAGYELGDPFVLIRAKNKSKLEKFLRNENVFIPNDTSTQALEGFANMLTQKRIEVLMGYPSVMYALAIFLNENPENKRGLKIKTIISVSEPLEQEKRRFIFEVFGCKFVDRYSNEEVGLIAQQEEFNGSYLVNSFGIITEIVNPETNLPVNEGEQGKVLVTDLNNDLIPVVRYDTGDLATACEYRDGFLHRIESIQGRIAEQLFSTNGTPISSLMLGPYIYKPLSIQGKVFQYQFAQIEQKRYELRIKGSKGDLPTTVENHLIDNLASILGEDAAVNLIYVVDIKPQPSGKRPVFKNEYIKK